MKKTLTLLFLLGFISQVIAQDKTIYSERKNGFYQDSIQAGIKAYNADKPEGKETQHYLSMDFSHMDFPTNKDDYRTLWHNSPLSQGATGTCWCFASTSFLESEVYRITGEQVKLSEMYAVYWEYVARADYFVDHRGDMYFGQGSESNALMRIIQEHGVVPALQYTGLLPGQKYHNHGPLAREIGSYLKFIQANNIWDKNIVVSNVRSILDHHLGEPPTRVIHQGKEITPLQYMQDVLQLVPDDYYSFMSTRSANMNEKGELLVPDNWWHNADYYNLPLTDFASLISQSLENGYTLSICGDVSEPGYDRYAEVGIIPTFDIPGDYIDEHARAFRISNGSTTDDHCIHIVGSTEQDGVMWYLIKDSSSSGFDGPTKGYRFIREDYVKLKVLGVMTHKYAARDILDKIIK